MLILFFICYSYILRIDPNAQKPLIGSISQENLFYGLIASWIFYLTFKKIYLDFKKIKNKDL